MIFFHHYSTNPGLDEATTTKITQGIPCVSLVPSDVSDPTNIRVSVICGYSQIQVSANLIPEVTFNTSIFASDPNGGSIPIMLKAWNKYSEETVIVDFKVLGSSFHISLILYLVFFTVLGIMFFFFFILYVSLTKVRALEKKKKAEGESGQKKMKNKRK